MVTGFDKGTDKVLGSHIQEQTYTKEKLFGYGSSTVAASNSWFLICDFYKSSAVTTPYLSVTESIKTCCF